jgi:enoyl-CoA hydratase
MPAEFGVFQFTDQKGKTQVLYMFPFLKSYCGILMPRCSPVDSHVARSLADAFIAFERDSTACVAILSGSSGVFCAGADLKALGDSTKPELGSRRNQLSPVDVQHPVEPSGATLDTTGPMGVSRMMLSKPVIASISGYCVAGGLV